MDRPLPPPPPRHPSSGSRSVAFSSQRRIPLDNRTAPLGGACLPSEQSATTVSTFGLPADCETEPDSGSLHSSTAPRSENDDVAHLPSRIPPPPRHPNAERATELDRKLLEIEDLEIAEILDRVGGRLTELQVSSEEERQAPTDFPEQAAFQDEEGRTNWTSFVMAYICYLVVARVPPTLVGHPPRTIFSFRSLRDDLSRLYVLCPPSVLQGYLLKDVAKLYRWEDPARTSKAAAIYTFLWFFNLLPLVPVGFLIYQLLIPRLAPPSPEQILKTSYERRSRTKEAAELSDQLQNSSAARGIGLAAEGIRSTFHEIREKIPGSTTRFEPIDFANLSGSNDDEDTSCHGGDTPPTTDDPEQVSLYRLVRHLTGSFGPPLQTILNESIDLLEMLRNVIQHPDHPSSTPILWRLSALFLAILLTPTWLRLKSAFGYLGIEFFVLWRLRELFPQYRRATMFHWWILAGAPTDAEYALFILRKRGEEGRTIRGSKTIRRMARKSRVSSNADQIPTDKLKPWFKAVSDNASIRSFASSTTSNNPTHHEKTAHTYFAFHRSVPGQIVLTSSSIRFVPARRLRKLGFNKLVARAAKKWDPSIELDESHYYYDSGHDARDDSVDDSAEGKAEGNTLGARDLEMALKVTAIEKVKKEKQYRLPALVITSKSGETWKFTNVSRRDDAFNKILSFSASCWTNRQAVSK